MSVDFLRFQFSGEEFGSISNLRDLPIFPTWEWPWTHPKDPSIEFLRVWTPFKLKDVYFIDFSLVTFSISVFIFYKNYLFTTVWTFWKWAILPTWKYKHWPTNHVSNATTPVWVFRKNSFPSSILIIFWYVIEKVKLNNISFGNFLGNDW